ncbi:hypothetical protein BT67DRAFT_439696 [Trichocladium antarcticum]|uniref:ATP synthase F(0) complex subunit e, mitochondrial n=1 Tax=Trichocladium antarcticum TaxID=1450529 RepID=A0AAN6UP89_9PEZI|nr:hypothetical protein BT67DRAFT_439696 [Trichocladium antarcticum]
MSSKSGVNVLRYSALGLGIFYGVYHQRSISAAQKAAHAQEEYKHKEELINKAKAAYAKQKAPAASSTAVSLEDIASPNFDLEAYLQALMQKA